MNEKIFDTFPALETSRLILRQIKEEDTEGIYKFNSDIKSLQFIARNTYTKMEQATEKFEQFQNAYSERKAIWWTYTLKTDDNFIGHGGLFDIDKENGKAEIGYGLLPGYWGKGYNSEAVEKIIDFGLKEMKLHRIYGLIVPGNDASVRVLEKFGFQKEGLLRDNGFARNKYFDMGIYSFINNK
jgi:ribosomal-protein-alanine N-acetyltransferase